MTISSTTNTVSYTGTGSATSFSVTYVFFGTGTTAEIEVVEVVIATGAETVKSNGSDFTVSGGSGATGTVTAAVAPANTVKWVINRTTTQTQETDYVENDPFPAESHEEALDRLTAVDQEQQRALERTAQLPDGYTGSFDPTLPTNITGSAVLAFNSAATAFEVGPTAAAISGAEASATAAAASAATASAYAGTQAVDRFNGTGSQTAFTLSVAPANGDENNTMVFVSGVYIQKNVYSISGTTLTFASAPASATGNIEVMHMSQRAIETPADGSVTYPKFASGLVDTDLTSASGSDNTIASAKAIKTYVDANAVLGAEANARAYGVVPGAGDVTSAFNTMIASIRSAGVTTLIQFESGVYDFDSLPSDLGGLRLRGAGSSHTQFRVNYNPANNTAGVFNFTVGKGGGISNLMISANTACQRGSAIFIGEAAGGGSTDGDYTICEDIVITEAHANGVWYNAVTLSGDQTSSGIRDVDLRDFDIFASSNASIYINGGVSCTLIDMRCFTAAGVVSKIIVDGTGSATTTQLYIDSSQANDLVVTEATYSRFEGFWGTVTTGSGAENNYIASPSVTGAISDSGTNNIIDSGIARTGIFNLQASKLKIADVAVTATGNELNYNDTGAAVGTVVASKTVTADANKDVASLRNLTITGELDAATLDISGAADIAGAFTAPTSAPASTLIRPTGRGPVQGGSTPNQTHELMWSDTNHNWTGDNHNWNSTSPETSATRLTFGGTATTSDVINIRLTYPITATQVITYTVQSGDDVEDIIDGLVTNGESNSTAVAAGGWFSKEGGTVLAFTKLYGNVPVVANTSTGSGSTTISIPSDNPALDSGAQWNFGRYVYHPTTDAVRNGINNDIGQLFQFIQQDAGGAGAVSCKWQTRLINTASGSVTGGFEFYTTVGGDVAHQYMVSNGVWIGDYANASFNGNGTLNVQNSITGATLEADGDTSAGDNAAMGYTAAEGLILTGQGSTNDVTIKNDADAKVMGVLTGTTTAAFTGEVTATGFTGTLDGILGSGAAGAATVTTLNTTGAVTFNDAGADIDFRAESSNNANMLFVDGGNDRLGVGTATPLRQLHLDSSGSTVQLITAAAGYSANIFFGTTSDDNSGRISYAINDEAMAFWTNDASQMTIDNAGAVNMPSQPAFQGEGATQNDVTGDGTSYTVTFATENYDQGGDFVGSTGIFTAPVAGKYLFTAAVSMSGITSDMDQMQLKIVTSHADAGASLDLLDTNNLGSSNGRSLSVISGMAASDTARVTLYISGGSKVVDITTGPYSTFSGALIA